MDDLPIGGVQTRWLDDGRVELGSMDAGGGIVPSNYAPPNYATCPQVDIRTIDVQHIGTIYQ